jgi:hypothetical protein
MIVIQYVVPLIRREIYNWNPKMLFVYIQNICLVYTSVFTIVILFVMFDFFVFL